MKFWKLKIFGRRIALIITMLVQFVVIHVYVQQYYMLNMETTLK